VDDAIPVVRQGGDLGGGVEVTDGVVGKLPKSVICSRKEFRVDPEEQVIEIATKLVVEKPGTQKIQGPVHLDEGIWLLLFAEHHHVLLPSLISVPGHRLADHTAWSMFAVVPALAKHGRSHQE